MGLLSSYKSTMTQYAKFSGRATRSEFWFSAITIAIIILVPEILSIFFGLFQIYVAQFFFIGLYYVFIIIHFLPGLALQSRRLHDAGHSFDWIFVVIIPVVGYIILFLFYIQGSKKDNKYGKRKFRTR